MNQTYVHATIRPFHPRNRYLVIDSVFVAEPGHTPGSTTGLWKLAPEHRQACTTPIGQACTCTVTPTSDTR